MTVPDTMRAMVLEAARQPLRYMQMAVPEPGPAQVLIRVRACGVCRTDLHVLDGDLSEPKLPVILGHEIVGVIVGTGAEVRSFAVGERVGVPWLASTDGSCRYCRRGQENLCDKALFTGYTVDGGFAEYALAHENYCFRLPEGYADAELAPLLCAGLIGYRTYRMAGEHAERIGIYGFGAAAHIIAQVAVHQGKRIYAFTRPGDVAGQAFARRLGAVWAGESGERPPEGLDAALIFAPAGRLIVDALRATCKGGVIVCGGIHMSDIPAFPYRLLWEERVIRSVANLTRQDAEELLSIAPQVPIKTHVQAFALEEANEALRRLRAGAIEGAAVLVMAQTDD
ncbi:MAG: putative alcohol dehydrogenase AdhA [Chromatiales bacterium USCg_Taylor]|nr:MAG: putative alcohol dehydrogenase AdhA [Chromatiales bacterium USCg_Taylor]